ncbi:hypothetical protein ACIPSE_41025 [Streptomyces sp. NPDC090106]|uniref:hypothetical protein n=1 Tax=Streptomyces sp. NPDC090106 TaxID=3365946 RepID=UPI00380B9CB7
MSERDEGRQKRIDLSVPQVAGSAVAAVAAAKLASEFGVYGTILGAGVVSVVATCGGSLFQHFFRRTGEQFRDATVTVTAGRPAQEAVAPGEFTEGTVYRARVKSWKRPLVAAALVFGITMTGVTAYELASGRTLDGNRGTSVSDALSGGGSSSKTGTTGTTETAGTDGTDGADTTTGTGGATESADPGGEPTPSASAAAPSPSTSASTATEEQGTGGDSGTTAGATPSETAVPDASATSPAPAASSRSGTAGQDRAGP